MSTMASQIASLTIVYSTVYSGADQRKHHNSASLAFVRGIHRWPVNFPHKGPVTRKMFQFDDVIMILWVTRLDSKTFASLCNDRQERYALTTPNTHTLFAKYLPELSLTFIVIIHDEIYFYDGSINFFVWTEDGRVALIIESVKTTSMENENTWVLCKIRALFETWK